MPTKEHRREARGLVEALEFRVHAGPPVCEMEILSARAFLRERDFSEASDYFNRLAQIQNRVASRPVTVRPEKRNYGGEAAGRWMQVQSVYDHVLLSVCFDGEFNLRRGRVKLSHRFNAAGRVDFVELKLLRSLQPGLDGSIRKLFTVKAYQNSRKDWQAAEAFTLRVLPQELVILFEDSFRCRRDELLAWLINQGHWTVADLLDDLKSGRVNGHDHGAASDSSQLPLQALREDEVALPILKQAATLESVVECSGAETVTVRYVHKGFGPFGAG